MMLTMLSRKASMVGGDDQKRGMVEISAILVEWEVGGEGARERGSARAYSRPTSYVVHTS